MARHRHFSSQTCLLLFFTYLGILQSRRSGFKSEKVNIDRPDDVSKRHFVQPKDFKWRHPRQSTPRKTTTTTPNPPKRATHLRTLKPLNKRNSKRKISIKTTRRNNRLILDCGERPENRLIPEFSRPSLESLMSWTTFLPTGKAHFSSANFNGLSIDHRLYLLLSLFDLRSVNGLKSSLILSQEVHLGKYETNFI